jgi:hypothetical protein
VVCGNVKTANATVYLIDPAAPLIRSAQCHQREE